MAAPVTLMVRAAEAAVRLTRRTALRARAPRRTSLGTHFIIGPGARIARGTTLQTGMRVNIGADFVSEVDLVIGDNVMISSSVAFIGNDHAFDDPALDVQSQRRLPRSRTVVEGDNLIGYGTVILGNVTIGYGAIVGAGSLVTKDIPANSISYGRPAVPRGMRR